MNIVLHQPEIHLNTGNIGRTCVITGSSLHLIEPLGFKLNDKMIKRAGLDYWDRLDVHRHLNYEEFLQVTMRSFLPSSFSEKKMTEKANTLSSDPGINVDISANTAPKIWFATTKAHRAYSEVSYGPDDYIMFGKESGGIPREILDTDPDACIRIPMLPDERSLNLANSVCIILYEALRQNGFPTLR